MEAHGCVLEEVGKLFTAATQLLGDPPPFSNLFAQGVIRLGQLRGSGCNSRFQLVIRSSKRISCTLPFGFHQEQKLSIPPDDNQKQNDVDGNQQCNTEVPWIQPRL